MIGNVIGKGTSLLGGIVVARFLGKEIYGEYGTIKNTLIYIAIVSTFGFGYSATKFVAEYIKDKKAYLNSLIKKISIITLTFSGFLTLILTIFAEPIAYFINAPSLIYCFRYYSIMLVFNAMCSTQIAILSGLKAFKDTAKINIISGIVVFILSIFLSYYYGLNGALLALLISLAVQFIYGQLIISKLVNINDFKGYQVCNSDIKNLLFFSLPIALQESLYTIVNWLTLLLLIKYSNYGEVGLSAASATWYSIVIFIPGMLKNVMFSYLSSSNNHEMLVNKLLLFNFAFTFIPVLILLIFSNWICSFYGPSFIGLQKVLIVNLICSVFVSSSEVYCYEFISVGKPWIVFAARLLRDSLLIIISYIVIINIYSSQAFYLSVIVLFVNVIFLILLAIKYKTRYKIRN